MLHCISYPVRAQLDRLVDLPGVRWVFQLPGVAPILEGILPQLVLRVFLALLPTLLAWLGRFEGLPAESDVEFGVVRKYFAFQARFSQAWRYQTLKT